MSSPLYTCRESAEITSPRIRRASLTAKALFPDAVGPTITMTFCVRIKEA
jgi:hypothetical protein